MLSPRHDHGRRSCIEVARELEEQFPDPCEWNPAKSAAAFGCEVHAAAELIVGADGQWRLCGSCAALPEFNRFKIRKVIWRKDPSMARHDDTPVTCRIVDESEKSFRVIQDSSAVDCWIPKSRMRYAERFKVDPGQPVIITIPEWLANDRELK